MVNVLFVCLGNICRSPTAHGIFRQRVQQAQLDHLIQIESAGTGHWHVGASPDARAAQAAAERGYDLSDLVARQVSEQDFSRFQYILAMDEDNLRNLQGLRPADYAGELCLFLDYLPDQPQREVPDPYYGGKDGFQQVLDLVENGADALLAHIRRQHQLTG